MTGRMGGTPVGRRWLLVTLLVAVALTFGSAAAEHASSPVGMPGEPTLPPFHHTPLPTADCLSVGAAANAPGAPAGGPLAPFAEANSELGPLTVRRSFESSLPRTFSASSAATDPGAGLQSFVSWKPPHRDYRGAARGKYDSQVAAWARSVPRTGVYATAFHEPENNMTAASFVALQRHLYVVVKEANPTIRWGPVYMAYWWDPTSPDHYVGDPAAWWPGNGYADFAALDWYGSDPTPMTQSASFTTWYTQMLPTGLPLYIAEYGQYAVPVGAHRDPAKEKARVAAIHADAAWITAHKRIRMWLYWQGVGAGVDWRLDDKASQRAWRAIAKDGCHS